MTQSANLPTPKKAPEEAPPIEEEKKTLYGAEYQTTESGRVYFLDTPGLDNVVQLHWEQGWPESLISKNMGFPRDKVDAICLKAMAEYQSKGKPLPKRLGEKGANNTPPSEIG